VEREAWSVEGGAGCGSVQGGVNIPSEGEDRTHTPFAPKIATRCDTALVALDLRLDLPVSRVFLGFELRTELFVRHGVTRVEIFLGNGSNSCD
jgi:hypothetical protein